ncbi:mechanosensitive ion channel, partial [Barnesiella sp. GGCC_0306]|nr:mechanosensitive ion channel [Barnesiella sp. GGCC_0306]
AFGAQTLVKDVLAGLFIIFEDQYGVGDAVKINEVEGLVEDVGLRVTRIRDWNGAAWYLRNGEITKVGNVTQGWTTSFTDINVHPWEDPNQVI